MADEYKFLKDTDTLKTYNKSVQKKKRDLNNVERNEKSSIVFYII